MRRMRACANSCASTWSCDTPEAPWAWIALSATHWASSAAATLIAEISIRAPRHLDADASVSDPLADDALVDDRLAECLARGRAVDQQLKRALRDPDRAHRMMDAAGPQPLLRHPEAAALVAEHVRCWHADVIKEDFGVAPVRPVVVPEYVA
jgi:hypothetical protein